MPTDTLSPAVVQEQLNVHARDDHDWIAAQQLHVTDLASLVEANQLRIAIGERTARILALLDPPTKAADGLHKWFTGLRRAALAPLTALDNQLREEIRRFNDAETRRRQERERQIAEARRQAEQARAAEEAAALERVGERQLASAVLEEAIAAPAPVVALTNDVKTIQKFRRRWCYEVVDAAEVPRDFCVVDAAKLARYATAMKESARVPGVRFYYEDDPIR